MVKLYLVEYRMFFDYRMQKNYTSDLVDKLVQDTGLGAYLCTRWRFMEDITRSNEYFLFTNSYKRYFASKSIFLQPDLILVRRLDKLTISIFQLIW